MFILEAEACGYISASKLTIAVLFFVLINCILVGNTTTTGVSLFRGITEAPGLWSMLASSSRCGLRLVRLAGSPVLCRTIVSS